MNLIGVDLGGTKLEGAVLGPDRSALIRTRVPTESQRGYEHIVARIAALVEELRPHAPGATAVGVGTPGAISTRTGMLKNSNTICLNGRPLREDLAQRLPGLEVRLENDANCFALAEAVAGAGRGAHVVFGVIMGTGVGGGIVVNGALWSGLQHLAGEWGHHRIAADGPPCYCGQRGCVESFIAGPAVERRYAERTGEPIRLPEIVARAERGEPAASAVAEQFFDDFGRSLANVINILDPDVIVLGGGLSKIEALYTRGAERVRHYVFNDELRTPIVRNQLGDSAGVVGAALLCE